MSEKRLSGKKILMVICPEDFRDEELLMPKEIFEREGAEVKIAASRSGRARGMLGATVEPDLLIAQARAGDFDAVVVVGGLGSPTYLWSDGQLHALLREAEQRGKVIGAICLSGAVLARAGLLRHRRATVYATRESLDEFTKGGALYTSEDVVTEGKIVTASGPHAAAGFAEAIVTQIVGGS
jgi:protease I